MNRDAGATRKYASISEAVTLNNIKLFVVDGSFAFIRAAGGCNSSTPMLPHHVKYSIVKLIEAAIDGGADEVKFVVDGARSLLKADEHRRRYGNSDDTAAVVGNVSGPANRSMWNAQLSQCFSQLFPDGNVSVIVAHGEADPHIMSVCYTSDKKSCVFATDSDYTIPGQGPDFVLSPIRSSSEVQLVDNSLVVEAIEDMYGLNKFQQQMFALMMGDYRLPIPGFGPVSARKFLLDNDIDSLDKLLNSMTEIPRYREVNIREASRIYPPQSGNDSDFLPYS